MAAGWGRLVCRGAACGCPHDGHAASVESECGYRECTERCKCCGECSGLGCVLESRRKRPGQRLRRVVRGAVGRALARACRAPQLELGGRRGCLPDVAGRTRVSSTSFRCRPASSFLTFWPRLFGRCHRRSGGGQTPCRYAVNFVLPQLYPTGTNETSAEPLRCAPGLFASVDVQCAGRNGCGMPSRMYDPNRLSLRKLLQQRKGCRTKVPHRDLCFANLGSLEGLSAAAEQ